MDARQGEEVLLTAAQSLFAVAVLADRSFSTWEAWLIAGLFCTQLLFVAPGARYGYSVAYFALAGVLLLGSRHHRTGLAAMIRAALGGGVRQ